MEWNEILALRAWSPLSDIQESAEPVIEGLFKIGKDAYVRTQALNKNLEPDDPRAPFMTRAYWGSSADAVKREILGDCSIGGKVSATPPPQELLLGTSGTYGELVDRARAAGVDFSERAIYSSAGRFLYKVVTSGRMSYCFLNNKENDAERTFLIQVALVRT